MITCVNKKILKSMSQTIKYRIQDVKNIKNCFQKNFFTFNLSRLTFHFSFIILFISLLCFLTSKCCEASENEKISEEIFTKEVQRENSAYNTSVKKANIRSNKILNKITPTDSNTQELTLENAKPDSQTQTNLNITCSLRNASLQEVANALSRLSGKNIVADAGIGGNITLDLKQVSLATALSTLSVSQGVSYVEKDNVIFIAKDDKLKNQSVDFYTFHLNYIRATDIQKTLSAIINGGKIAADAVTNTLLFNGSPAEARKIRDALQKMDTASQQVTLEAKIVSIEQSNESNLGLQWNWDTLPQYNNTAKHNSGNASSDSNHQGHLRLWNRTQAEFRFTTTLNALISSGKAKVLATPSLITLPGKEASIFIGSHIPVLTEKHNNGESTYSTEYVDAGIKLQYTPIVSNDGFITSVVHTEVSTPTLISELKNYRINSRTADTNVRMRNGETLVIGGLINEEEQKQLQQIPFLSKIPVLGALFRNHYKSKNKTEVVMLLTPYLSDAGKSPAIYKETPKVFTNT